MSIARKVKFIIVSESELSTIPLTPGAVIALRDRPRVYYDAWAGESTKRFEVTNVAFVAEFPPIGYTDMLYVYYNQAEQDADKRTAGLYRWVVTEEDQTGKYVRVEGLGIEQAPDDGRTYNRRGQDWVPLEFVYEANGQDDKAINDLLKSMIETYQSVRLSIWGDLNLTDTSLTTALKLTAGTESSQLFLDFSACNRIQISGASTILDTNGYRGQLHVIGLHCNVAFSNPNGVMIRHTGQYAKIQNCTFLPTSSSSQSQVQATMIELGSRSRLSCSLCCFSFPDTSCTGIKVLEGSAEQSIIMCDNEFISKSGESCAIRFDKYETSQSSSAIIGNMFYHTYIQDSESQVKLDTAFTNAVNS